MPGCDGVGGHDKFCDMGMGYAARRVPTAGGEGGRDAEKWHETGEQ